MKRVFVGVVGVLLLGAFASCFGTVGIAGDYETDGYPPDGFIATASPVYYEGHASYWYGGRWFYRDGGGWRSYHQEPGHLYAARSRAVPARQYYGRAHGGGYRRR
jgi:hypothetical protein